MIGPLTYSGSSDKRAKLGSPILLTDVAAEVRSAQGKIWMIECHEFGSQIRATINRRNVRVVLRSLTNPAKEIPDEKNSSLHVVHSLDALRTWLSKFSVTKKG